MRVDKRLRIFSYGQKPCKSLESLQNFKLALQLHLAEVFCHALFEVVYRYCQLIESLFHADQQVCCHRDGKGRLKSGRQKFLQKFPSLRLNYRSLKSLRAPPRKPLAFAMSASHYVRPAKTRPQTANTFHFAGKPPRLELSP